MCIYIYIYIYIYKYIIYISIICAVEKKENTLIIHSSMETWKYTIIRNFIILYLCPFSKISHPLDSEPAMPLTFTSNTRLNLAKKLSKS